MASTIRTDNGAYTAVATQTRQATEKSAEVFKNSPKTLTDQLDQLTPPTVDLTEPVARYFEYVQKAVDLNHDLITKWAELVTTLSGSFREQAEKVAGIVKVQTHGRRPDREAGREGRAGSQGTGRAGRAGQARAG